MGTPLCVFTPDALPFHIADQIDRGQFSSPGADEKNNVTDAKIAIHTNDVKLRMVNFKLLIAGNATVSVAIFLPAWGGPCGEG